MVAVTRRPRDAWQHYRQKMLQPCGRAFVLAELVQEHGWARGAEIGVFRGQTLLHLLRSCPELQMIGVDAWDPAVSDEVLPSGQRYSDFDLRRHHDALEQELRETGFDSRAVLLRMPSLEAAEMTPDVTLNFVFIDADHREAALRADIAAWTPKIRAGGWLLGHDYDPRFPDVVKVVDELFPSARHFDDHVWGLPRDESGFPLLRETP